MPCVRILHIFNSILLVVLFFAVALHNNLRIHHMTWILRFLAQNSKKREETGFDWDRKFGIVEKKNKTNNNLVRKPTDKSIKSVTQKLHNEKRDTSLNRIIIRRYLMIERKAKGKKNWNKQHVLRMQHS